ncbi:hypothetical protein AXG93_2839s1020 [Marchantia polymorpha subsp. ruderalis]|uniref:Glycosylphosphatidylinositol anchor biosynthesis protein 11 n=1 Tax=Marchantia polymorpha subsp. ruderalis TaxID=1480154 RepID=A0A176VEK1_MARPO|nr:hypothetical protein AXG93_2839s1020 [Marchantia polymorpha subsp. ruderalis]
MEGAKVETRKREFSGKDAGSVRKQIADAHTQEMVHRSKPCAGKVGIVQALCGTGVFLGLWFVPAMMGYNLIDQPVETLRICFALSFPVLLISYSTLRLQPEICPVVPVAVVVGGSWSTWHRLFARTEPDGPLELALCLSAHCAAIGSWVGAWPMPLDWERRWQEWPVCCTYGTVGGYLLSVIFSIAWYSANRGASSEGEKKKVRAEAEEVWAITFS